MTDFEYELQVYPTTTSQVPGVIVYASSYFDYYVVTLSTTLQLWNHSGTTCDQRVEVLPRGPPLALPLSTWTRVRMVCAAGTIEVFIDSVLTHTWTLGAVPAGMVGFYCINGPMKVGGAFVDLPAAGREDLPCTMSESPTLAPSLPPTASPEFTCPEAVEVRVSNGVLEYLTLCEIQVLDMANSNVAPAGIASMTSTGWSGQPASAVNDGNTSAESWVHTDVKAYSEHVSIILAAPTRVRLVRLYARTSHSERSEHLIVTLLLNGGGQRVITEVNAGFTNAYIVGVDPCGTSSPTAAPVLNPTASPSASPTLPPLQPTDAPTGTPTQVPTASPTAAPSQPPTVAPSLIPSAPPTGAPQPAPSVAPSLPPAALPTTRPSASPSQSPSASPAAPTAPPSLPPLAAPSSRPSRGPAAAPSAAPSGAPTAPPLVPSAAPSAPPYSLPSAAPSVQPSAAPTVAPYSLPSAAPSAQPSAAPTVAPSPVPSAAPLLSPSRAPSASPSVAPSWPPSTAPTRAPRLPTAAPSAAPSAKPSAAPSAGPSPAPTSAPASSAPSTHPTRQPSRRPSMSPSAGPAASPTAAPSVLPSAAPTTRPSAAPQWPTAAPTLTPTSGPTVTPCPCVHGQCVAGSCCPWSCACQDSAEAGHWKGPVCAECRAGWWGPMCRWECAGGACRACSGHGRCRDGTGGDGQCECDAKWVGAACDLCAEGWGGPGCAVRCGDCSGHGACDRATGGCVCEEGWEAASQCKERVAVCGGGGVCSGHGQCVGGGRCQCDGSHWGPGCEEACVHCVGGKCDSAGGCVCEGRRDAQWNCSRCAVGWWGADCEAACNDCGPHAAAGGCDSSSGGCRCAEGWAGPACETECPGAGRTCGGHGQCAEAAGCLCRRCVCDGGWGGGQCGVQCGCSAHGRCDDGGQCTCAARWSGPTCAACESGFAGAACDVACVHGVTAGTACRCEAAWSGVGCDKPCPAAADGVICGGRGQCVDGRCVCQPDWYGPLCAVHCSIAGGDCGHLAHPACGSDGSCVCLDAELGHWGGSACDTCNPMFWGPECRQPCDCMGHGTCRSHDGRCSCYGDPARGFWGGSKCGDCAAGYTGRGCFEREVPLTRLPAVAARAVQGAAVAVLPEGPDGMVSVAADSGVRSYAALTGARPSEWGPVLTSVEEPRGARAGWVAAGFVWVATATTLWRRPTAARGALFAAVSNLAVGDVAATCLSQDGSRLLLQTDCTAVAVSGARMSTRELRLGTADCAVAGCDAGYVAVCASTGSGCTLGTPNGATAALPDVGGTALAAGVHVGAGCAFVVLKDGDGVHAVTLSLAPPHAVLARGLVTRDTSVSAAVVVTDPAAPVMYACLDALVVRLFLPSAVVMGSLRLGEPVEAAAASAAERLLYAAGRGTGQLSVVPMHWAEAVQPAVADVGGGTEVIVDGVGFGDAGGAGCLFQEVASVVAAAGRSTSQRVCVAPKVRRPACSGSLVDVVLQHGFAGTSVASLRYVTPPLLSSGELFGRSEFLGAAWNAAVVRIAGLGLMPAASATCVFFRDRAAAPRLFANSSLTSAVTGAAVAGAAVLRGCVEGAAESECEHSGGAGAAAVLHTPAVVAGGAAVCRQPKIVGGALGLRWVDVALDGQRYTGAPLEYPIAHTASGLSVPAVHYVQSGVEGKPLELFVVDGMGTRLHAWDSAARTISVLLTVGGVTTEEVQFLVENGTGVAPAPATWPRVAEVARRQPPRCGVTFLDLSSNWTASMTLHVLPGRPVALAVVQQPSSSSDNERALAVQPVVAVVDDFGTVCTTGPGAAVAVTVSQYPEAAAARPRTVPAGGGLARFEGLVVMTADGVDTVLVFTSSGLASARSRTIRIAPCRSNQYLSGSQCRLCPAEGASCNGTDMLPMPGWWKASPQSSDVWMCHSADVCRGGADGDAQCDEGTAGVLCGGCADGYAKPRLAAATCSECWGEWRGPLVAMLMGIAALGIVLHCALSAAQRLGGRRHNARRVVVLRCLVVFLQVLGKFDEYRVSIPEPLQSVIFLSSRLVLFDASLYQPFNCAFHSKWLLLQVFVFFPVVAVLLGAVCAGLVVVVRRKGRALGKLARRVPDSVPLHVVMGASCSCWYVLVYPTMMSQFFLFTRCDHFGTDLSGAMVDMTTGCDDSPYRDQRVVAAVAGLVYGGFIPLFFLVAHCGAPGASAPAFVYLLEGFRPARWFWAVVVLLRELGVLLPAALMPDPRQRMLQLHLGMLVVQAGFYLHLWFSPLTWETANRLETISLGFAATVVVVSPLFVVSNLPPVGRALLAVLLTVGVLAVVLMHVYYLLPSSLQQRLRAAAKKARRSKRRRPLRTPSTSVPRVDTGASWDALLLDAASVSCRPVSPRPLCPSPSSPAAASYRTLTLNSSPDVQFLSPTSLPRLANRPVRSHSAQAHAFFCDRADEPSSLSSTTVRRRPVGSLVSPRLLQTARVKI